MSVPPDAATPVQQSGVIHNIGYRSYDGPRLGRAYATRSLFVQGLRGTYGLGRSGKSKVLPMLLLAVTTLVAVIVVVVATVSKSKELALDYPEFLGSVGLLVEIFLAAQAPVLMSRDLRFNVVPLYFSRPITRSDYVRAKFAAMTSAMLIIMVLPLVVLYLGAVLNGMEFGHNTAHFLYGVATACLYAVLYAALGLLISASTPKRGFGVAAIMGVLLVSSIFAHLIQAIVAGTGRPSEASNWFWTLSPGTLVDWLTNWVFDLTGGNPSVPHAPGAFGAVVFGVELLLLVAGSYWLLLRRYRKI